MLNHIQKCRGLCSYNNLGVVQRLLEQFWTNIFCSRMRRRSSCFIIIT